MINYKKHIGKKVLITDEGIYFGKTATLINVVPTEWFSGTRVAHLSIEGSIAIALPVTKIAIMLKTNTMGENNNGKLTN